MEDIFKIIEYIKNEFKSYEFITENHLKENYIMTTIKNPSSDRNLYIEFNSHNEEMTLYFGDYHAHYDFTPDDFNELLKTIKDVVSGKLLGISVYIGNRWLYSSLENSKNLTKKYINNLVKDISSNYKINENQRVVIMGWNVLDCKVFNF